MTDTGPIAIGVDVGGSGIKAAAIDTTRGVLASERIRVPTPLPSTPAAVIASIFRLVRRIESAVGATGLPVGVDFPAVILDGKTMTAANVDRQWIGYPAVEHLERALGRPVTLVNDADAAGLAEMRFGAGAGHAGVVLVLTLGTGVGSALFVDGVLVPNTELGHMEIRGRDAERRSAAAARVRRGISWKAWAEDLDEHLQAIDRILWPDLIVLGGGVSKNGDRFIPRLTCRPPVLPAVLRNEAGMVGAAMFALERWDDRPASVRVPPTEEAGAVGAAAEAEKEAGAAKGEAPEAEATEAETEAGVATTEAAEAEAPEAETEGTDAEPGAPGAAAEAETEAGAQGAAPETAPDEAIVRGASASMAPPDATPWTSPVEAGATAADEEELLKAAEPDLPEETVDVAVGSEAGAEERGEARGTEGWAPDRPFESLDELSRSAGGVERDTDGAAVGSDDIGAGAVEPGATIDDTGVVPETTVVEGAEAIEFADDAGADVDAESVERPDADERPDGATA